MKNQTKQRKKQLSYITSYTYCKAHISSVVLVAALSLVYDLKLSFMNNIILFLNLFILIVSCAALTLVIVLLFIWS